MVRFPFWQRLKFDIGRGMAPFAEPELFDVPAKLRPSVTAQVVVDAIPVPKHTPDLCPSEPEIAELDGFLTVPEALDLTAWFEPQLSMPAIESLFIPLKPPVRAGKRYGEEEEAVQPQMFPSPEPGADERCRHGLPRGTCAVCSRERDELSKREGKVRPIDVFEMILPVLMPSLEDNLDNPLVFPHPLYPFQREGIKFLGGRESALLGDEMGLGKTVQAIVAARCLFGNATIGNGIVVCPKSILRKWGEHVSEWAPELRAQVVVGAPEVRRVQWETPAHLYLVTYDTWRQDETDIRSRTFDLCILDEPQRIKNLEAKTTQAVRRIRAVRRWGLTGTPLENRVEELITIFGYLKPGLLKREDAEFLARVKERIKPYFLRRWKKDVLPELPPKRRDDIWLDLEPGQRVAYDKAEEDGVVTLSEKGETATVQHVFALISKLKQICNLDLASGESCKLEYLIHQLENILEEESKALVFSQFPHQTLERLSPRLAPFKPLLYHGGLSDRQRKNIETLFKENREHVVLLVSTKAGGLGLDLTEANYVFHFDLWWNPATALQAEGRADRIGQGKPVFVQSLLTKDTIEERIQVILERKGLLFQEVIDDLSETDVSRALSEEELFGLFGLEAPGRKKVTTDQKKLNQISPREFEHLVSRLYERMGYRVQLTQPTRDEGVDLYATRTSDSGTERLAIQCKHYPSGTVGVEVAQRMAGVLHTKPNITRGVLVTSGTFSSGCRELAEGGRIQLVDGANLLGLLAKYSVSLEGPEPSSRG